MKEKLLLTLVFLLIATVAIVRYRFSKNTEEFKATISEYEQERLKAFQDQTDSKLPLLSSKDPKTYKVFAAKFDPKNAL